MYSTVYIMPHHVHPFSVRWACGSHLVLCLWSIKPLGTFMHKFLCRRRFSFLLGKYLGMEWQVLMVGWFNSCLQLSVSLFGFVRIFLFILDAILYQIWVLPIFSPILWLTFSYSGVIFPRGKVFNLKFVRLNSLFIVNTVGVI